MVLWERRSSVFRWGCHGLVTTDHQPSVGLPSTECGARKGVPMSSALALSTEELQAQRAKLLQEAGMDYTEPAETGGVIRSSFRRAVGLGGDLRHRPPTRR